MFGDKLKQLREAAGLTQADLAEKSGVSKGAIRDLEQNPEKSPRFDNVQAICKALGVDCTAFDEAKPAKKRRK
jgi:transcriptional regulator with XRE-family HTH domain